MSPEVLDHKLEAQDDPNPEVAWNVKLVPKGMGQPEEVDRLFVASQGEWKGYFVLSREVLFSPEDDGAPWTLLFDARSWTPILPVSALRFRGLRPLEPKELGVSPEGERKERGLKEIDGF